MARLSLALPEEYDLLRIEMTKAARLRQLIAKDCVAMPGVPNASIARQVERAGFDAVYISGAGTGELHCRIAGYRVADLD